MTVSDLDSGAVGLAHDVLVEGLEPLLAVAAEQLVFHVVDDVGNVAQSCLVSTSWSQENNNASSVRQVGRR
jgi:hypothetical protein